MSRMIISSRNISNLLDDVLYHLFINILAALHFIVQKLSLGHGKHINRVTDVLKSPQNLSINQVQD